MNSKQKLTEYNLRIGQKLRDARFEACMSQEQTGEIIGVTFQQMQKYERGINRVSAASLVALAEGLNKPIDYFFDKSKTVEDLGLGEKRASILKAVVALNSIEDANIIKKITSLIFCLSKAETPANS